MLDYQYSFSQYEKWIHMVGVHCETSFPNVEIDLHGSDNVYNYEYKRGKITLNKEMKPRTKLYAFLHEVGHLSRIMNNTDDGCFFLDISGERNIKEKVMTLMEEVLAWKEAEEIAARLDIPIEKRAWKRIMTESIKEYVEWLRQR